MKYGEKLIGQRINHTSLTLLGTAGHAYTLDNS